MYILFHLINTCEPKFIHNQRSSEDFEEIVFNGILEPFIESTPLAVVFLESTDVDQYFNLSLYFSLGFLHEIHFTLLAGLNLSRRHFISHHFYHFDLCCLFTHFVQFLTKFDKDVILLLSVFFLKIEVYF